MARKGIWILVALLISTGLFGMAVKWQHEGTPGQVLGQKAVAVLEAAKGSGIHWNKLFLFVVIAIPSVAILTRLIAWLCGRKKRGVLSQGVKLLGDLRTAKEVALAQELEARVEGIEWVEPKIGKPYGSYEEYKKDLMGDVDLEEFLARCRAGVPKDPMKADLAKMKSAREKLAGIRERLEKTPVSAFPNAVVPVATGGAGQDGGSRVVGIGSPPPTEDQPKRCRYCNKVGEHLFPCAAGEFMNTPR